MGRKRYDRRKSLNLDELKEEPRKSSPYRNHGYHNWRKKREGIRKHS